MDTTETYRKMRVAAIPDLGMGKPPVDEIEGIFFWQSMTIFVDDKGDWYFSNENDAVQLERQDQLQEMVCSDWGLQTICTRIEEFSKAYDGGLSITIDGSMEQLWLAFVMKEKYSKIWIGGDWN